MSSLVRRNKIIIIVCAAVFLTVLIIWLWRQENGQHAVYLGNSSDYIQKLRVEGTYTLSKNFNEQIVLPEKNYGYDLFSEKAKRNPRIDTLEKYELWAKQMKEAYPQLGTDETKIERGSADAIDLRVGMDDGINFLLEVDETDGVYTINEIRSYAREDKPDRQYDGNGCFLIAQDLSQASEDCPRW